MTLDISFSKAPHKNTEAAVLCFYNNKEPSPCVSSLNYEFSGFVDHVLEKSKSFQGKFGEVEILMLPDGAPYHYVVLLGLGEKGDIENISAEKLGGKLLVAIEARKIETIEFYSDNEHPQCAEISVHIAAGMKLRSYKFDQYKSPKPAADKTITLNKTHFVLFDDDSANDLYAEQAAIIEGTFWARNLVNEPPNVLYPDAYAKIIKAQLKPLGVEIDILDEKKMRKLGMGALLAVGQGSDNAPRMVVMRWKGDKDSPMLRRLLLWVRA